LIVRRERNIPIASILADCARNNFKPKTLDQTVLPVLEAYNWPGNARELRNVIERMAILSPGEHLTRDRFR
jgi:two-component system, NtrC family, nitrogen regulation response regulator NtrX